MKTLYKYMPYRKAFFENFLIRCTQRIALNDPFEMLPSVEYFAKFVQEIGYSRYGSTLKEIEENLNDIAHSQIGDSRFDNFGVISLTETPDNILMWSHYAADHKGLCIEFDTTHPFFSVNASGEHGVNTLKRVLYRKKRIDSLIMNEDGQIDPLPIFFQKSEEWAYEKEHRLLKHCYFDSLIYTPTENYNHEYKDQHPELESNSIIHIDGMTSLENHPLPGDFSVDPQVYFFSKIPKESIKSITIGTQFDDSVFVEFYKCIQDIKGSFHHDFKLYGSSIDRKMYQINTFEIPFDDKAHT